MSYRKTRKRRRQNKLWLQICQPNEYELHYQDRIKILKDRIRQNELWLQRCEPNNTKIPLFSLSTTRKNLKTYKKLYYKVRTNKPRRNNERF